MGHSPRANSGRIRVSFLFPFELCVGRELTPWSHRFDKAGYYAAFLIPIILIFIDIIMRLAVIERNGQQFSSSNKNMWTEKREQIAFECRIVKIAIQDISKPLARSTRVTKAVLLRPRWKLHHFCTNNGS